MIARALAHLHLSASFVLLQLGHIKKHVALDSDSIPFTQELPPWRVGTAADSLQRDLRCTLSFTAACCCFFISPGALRQV